MTEKHTYIVDEIVPFSDEEMEHLMKLIRESPGVFIPADAPMYSWCLPEHEVTRDEP